MVSRLPLSALLSQAFVAFVIEFDNEFEHQVPHRTTNHGSTPGHIRPPWLVSMAMWVRYLQYIPAQGIRFSELQQRTGISNQALQIWLTRLGRWWGYLSLPGAARGRIAPDALIRPSPGGMRAIEAWRPLTATIEQRWRDRFGSLRIDQLQAALVSVVSNLDAEVPDFFSVLESSAKRPKTAPIRTPAQALPLPQLLASTLIALSHQFDRESVAPLSVCANVLRVTADDGVRLRDLPRLVCLPRAGVDAAVRAAAQQGCATTGTATGAKLLRPTGKGMRARDAYEAASRRVEEEWRQRFGNDTLPVLREVLEGLAGDGGAGSPLLAGLTPYPDGWRAALPPLQGLPHFPMVSHRGGFPDGS